MKTPEGALRLRASPVKTENGYLSAAVASALLNVGQAFVFTPAFADAPFSPWTVAAWGMLIILLLLLAVRLRKKRWVLPAGVILFGGTALLLARRLMDGVFLLYNNFADLLCMRTGRIFLGMAVPEDAAAHIAVLFLTALSAALIACAAVYRDLLPALPLLVTAAAGGLSGLLPVNAGSTALAAGTVMLLFMHGVKLKKLTPRVIALPGAVLAAGVGLCLIAGTLPLNAAPAREAVSQALHTARFRDAHAYLPEGRFAALPGEAADDTPALTVTMDTPQKTYLRGYIGEVYAGTRWQGLDGETLLSGRDIFYWLHRYGFYGCQTVAAANRAIDAPAPQTVTVTAEKACRRYAYVPYGCADADLWDENAIGDAKLYGGKRSVSYTCYPEGTAAWAALLEGIVEKQDSGHVREYLSDEAAYREFVYNAYLEIPQTARDALERACAQIPAPETPAQAGGAVLLLLETRMPEKGGVTMPAGTEDFIADALARDTGGGTVHSATLAVLALRYYGVPARYVEGYLIDEADAAAMTPGEPYTLTMRHARAWAEYYVDGLGWIPFEPMGGGDGSDSSAQEEPVPPEETESESETESEPVTEEEDTTQDEESEEPTSEEPANEEPTSEEPTEEPAAETEDDGTDSAALPLWALALLLLLLLLLLAAAAAVLRARLRLRRKLKRMAAAPHREAVKMEYGYACLLRSLGAPVKAEAAAQAKELYYEACFSTHNITEEQRRKMRDYRVSVLAAGIAVWKPFTKCRLRWLRGVY